MSELTLKEILNNLRTKIEKEGREFCFSESVTNFTQAVQNFSDNFDAIMEGNRTLKLGIVGEVKAGKSSFLNSLIFDGEDILPKAPTPMTAALTKISYSDTPKAKIVFYDESDWAGIEKNSQLFLDELNKEYEKYSRENEEHNNWNKRRMPLSRLNDKPVHKMTRDEFFRLNSDKIDSGLKACYEVIQMMQERAKVDKNKYIGEEIIIEGNADNEKEYLANLNKYVGSDGDLTPLVKYTEIQLAKEMLRGIEIIDTPGLNDPILSRSNTTKKFLKACDAIFLLSYSGQFLGRDDMNFMLTSLPNEGINDVYIIASKFDAAVLQYNIRKQPNFEEAYVGTRNNLYKSAKENIKECAATTLNDKLIEKLKSSKPIMLSALAFTASKKLRDNIQLSSDEQLMINNLKRFPDFKTSMLEDMSGIMDIRKEVFEEVRKNKEAIINERINTFEKKQCEVFSKMLEEINIQSEQKRDDLHNLDLKDIEQRMTNAEFSLDSVRISVKHLFENAANDTTWKIENVIGNIKLELKNHDSIRVDEYTDTIHHSHSSGWWLWEKTEHWNEYINHSKVLFEDAVQALRDYTDKCKYDIVYPNFKKIVNIDSLKDKIKANILKAFEENDRNLDENLDDRIISYLETVLNKITFPDIKIDFAKYENNLISILSGKTRNGVVMDENISILKTAFIKELNNIADDMEENVRNAGSELKDKMNEYASHFIDDIVEMLSKKTETLKKEIKNKEENINKCNKFIEFISNAKKMICKA